MREVLASLRHTPDDKGLRALDLAAEAVKPLLDPSYLGVVQELAKGGDWAEAVRAAGGSLGWTHTRKESREKQGERVLRVYREWMRLVERASRRVCCARCGLSTASRG